MEKENINLLRKTLSLSLGEAKALLTECAGDIAACVTTYHQQNIGRICQKTRCDWQTAEQYYWRFFSPENPIEKAINKINAIRPIICLTPHLGNRHLIGFIFWAEKLSGENYQPFIPRQHSIFIPEQEFFLLRPFFEAVFPLQDFWGEVQEKFDVCGRNDFTKHQCLTIVEHLKEYYGQMPTIETDWRDFLQKVIHWLSKTLTYADKIIIEGNL